MPPRRRAPHEAAPDAIASGPTRRALLAGALAVGSVPTSLLAQSKTAPKAPATPAAPPPAPPKPDIAVVQMVAKPGFAELQPARPTEILSFGGTTPGPELRLRRGEDVHAKLVNSTSQPLSLHWHGMRIANEQDGVAGLTQEPVAPSASGDIRFVLPDSGTFIYRPMVPGMAGEQTDRGLAGMVIVEEASPPPVDLDIAIAVDDWRLDSAGQHEPFGTPAERAGIGRLGNLITVNGRPAPLHLTVAPGSRLRLRLANLCNARLMRIRFDGLKAYVIAVDSQPTDTFEPLRSTLPFAPTARYDILLEVPVERDVSGTLSALIGAGTPLLRITTQGDPATKSRPALPPIAPLRENTLLPAAIPLQKSQRADLVLQGGAQPGSGGLEYKGDPNRIWTINGVTGLLPGAKPGKPLVSVKRGTPLVMTAINKTNFAQVLHVHGHSVRVLHPFDDGWEHYWLDTITIPENQTVRFAFIADQKGRWLIGSAILERLDTGMSAWFEVT